jgi:iron complex outermembrane receptor protein/vitamin B12 transporter
MSGTIQRVVVCLSLLTILGAGVPRAARAQSADRTIGGAVYDPLGGAVSGATVALLRDGRTIADARTDAHGAFSFSSVIEGRYQVVVTAAGFAPRAVDPFAVVGPVTLRVTLQLGLQQEVVVTAAVAETPTSQIGAAVTVIDHSTLETLAKPDILEALRLVPGTNVVQTGARGGLTSLFVRGGNSNFNKVLIDGVAANDIGGAFNFADVATTGIDRVEMLRNPNSVLYGTDALTSVIDLTTRKGSSRTPEVALTVDGGNLHSSRQEGSIGGASGRIDYFGDVSHFGTDNSVPNNAYHNTTFASRFGVQLDADSNLSVTLRRMTSDYGSPNGIILFGIPDDSAQKADATYVSATYRRRVNDTWNATARFGSMEQGYHSTNPTPTGQPFDPFGSGPNYLGNVVTLTGANGYSVTGRAILDFNGVYPSLYDVSTKRQSASGSISGRLTSWLDLSMGGRYEYEDGNTIYNGSTSAATRNNGGLFVEGRAAFARAFITGGLGYDHNAIFKSAVTPRISAAVYVRTPSSTSAAGATKVTFNAGTGIKAPSISQQLSSLYAVVQAGGSDAAKSLVSPIGPERNRSVDAGIEQNLLRNHVVVRAAFFDNQLSDLIEYVSAGVLPQLGIPASAAAATGFGAYTNSSSYWARGLETSGEVAAGPYLKVSGSYTFMKAVITQSFASSALSPAINPSFPGIPIGAFGPLVGSAPFRRPRNVGSLLATVTRGPGQVGVATFFAGKADDSTFMYDSYFGNTMLLPNHNLNAGYAKVDVSGAYRIHPRLRWYVTLENALDQSYAAVFGFPALPRTVRTGLTVTLGGDPRP